MIYEKVLKELLENPNGFSGEVLANRLKTSRNSVWKAVNRLRREGYIIDGSTNQGYRLSSETNILNAEEVRAYLDPKITARLEIHKTVNSTNTRAKEIAENEQTYLRRNLMDSIVVADSQSDGRGRKGRRFVSNAACGIYMSFLLHPAEQVREAVCITSAAAVAVAEAIERLVRTDVKIKWVNDLLINGKKICGILTEASMDFESGGLKYVVLGIGINVKHTDFPEEIAEIASSIEDETQVALSRNRLCAEIINSVYDMLTNEASYMDEYRRRSAVIGKRVRVIRGDETYDATVEGIDDMGELIVVRDGQTVKLNSGEISIRL